MVCGLPIISTSIGDVGEVSQDGLNGLLIEGKDPQSLTSKRSEL